jgi:hypothetical protein
MYARGIAKTKNLVKINQNPGHDFQIAWKVLEITIETDMNQYVMATIQTYLRA